MDGIWVAWRTAQRCTLTPTGKVDSKGNKTSKYENVRSRSKLLKISFGATWGNSNNVGNMIGQPYTGVGAMAALKFHAQQIGGSQPPNSIFCKLLIQVELSGP
ncbi:hypothetical protein AAC387_Pa01g3583 [Persea americana]